MQRAAAALADVHKYKIVLIQGDDHFPDNVKYADISLMVRGTAPRHSAC